MAIHYTPESVAKVLARYTPSRTSSILEPSVGQGDLLMPILKKSKGTLKYLLCVDIDETVFGIVRTKVMSFSKAISLGFVHADYLEWADSFDKDQLKDYFDCVILNPPFCGRNENLVKVDASHWRSKKTELRYRSAPMEVAFIMKSLFFLRPGGRLLAVVPSSVVSSSKTNWFRRYILMLGSIDYVHELPKHTFKGVESRIYLLVYTKSNVQRNVMLRNHDLSKPVSAQISGEDLIVYPRFDYGYHRARLSLRKAVDASPFLNWVNLKEIAVVIRGSVKSPIKNNSVLHSPHFKKGFWTANADKKEMANDAHRIRRGDLIIKRVGRGCAKSIGKIVNHNNNLCSDCLLIIRPKKKISSYQLLFSLRTLLTGDLGSQLLERGTGATYVTARDLHDLKIPAKLAEYNSKLYASYRTAIFKQDIETMITIERECRKVYFT